MRRYVLKCRYKKDKNVPNYTKNYTKGIYNGVTLLGYMASLKKIIYVIGSLTLDDESKYMSVKDISQHFDEDCDHNTLRDRIRSQLVNHRNIFAIKRIGGRTFWRLNANGKKYLNKFKDDYDSITDRMLFQPDKIEVTQWQKPKRI